MRLQLVAFFDDFHLRFAKADDFGFQRLDVVLGALAMGTDYRISHGGFLRKRHCGMKIVNDDQRVLVQHTVGRDGLVPDVC